MLAAALLGDDPWAIHKRGLMPHMLAMAARQISHPIVMFIKMIADNGLVHDVLGCIFLAVTLSLPLFEP